MIRVVLPAHLKTLAQVEGEVSLELGGEATARAVIDALESTFPALRGTIRDPASDRRRPFIRFFACEEDLSHHPPDELLPASVVSGREPLYIVGAMAGG